MNSGQPDFVREYRDDFTIRIELGSMYERFPSEVYEVSHPSSNWTVGQAIDVLEGLTQDARLLEAAGTSCCGTGVPFTLDSKRSVTSWGADGAAEQVILRIAEWSAAGVIGSAAYAAVTDLLRRFGSDTAWDDQSLEPLEREEAYGLAEWGITRKYELPDPVSYTEDEKGVVQEVRDTSLELVEESYADGAWTFSWSRPPYMYSASVQRLEGYATLTHFRRSLL